MAKKRVTRKASAKKTTARKVARPVSSSRSISSSRSSKGFFQTHKNLKWIFPLFIILVVALLVVHHYQDEASMDEGSWKNDVRSMLHLNNDDVNGVVITATPTPGENSTITPYVTLSPTPDGMNSGY